jgi:hypothetical protein
MKRSERIAYWKEQIQKWSESGLSQKQFCEQNGLKTESFRRWKKSFTEPAAASEQNIEPKFVKVSRVESSVTAVVPPALKDEIILKLPEGIELRSNTYPGARWIVSLVDELSARKKALV